MPERPVGGLQMSDVDANGDEDRIQSQSRRRRIMRTSMTSTSTAALSTSTTGARSQSHRMQRLWPTFVDVVAGTTDVQEIGRTKKLDEP
jgi:hypothetical protein